MSDPLRDDGKRAKTGAMVYIQQVGGRRWDAQGGCKLERLNLKGISDFRRIGCCDWFN